MKYSVITNNININNNINLLLLLELGTFLLLISFIFVLLLHVVSDGYISLLQHISSPYI